VAHLSLAPLDRVAVEVTNCSSLRLRLVLRMPGGPVLDLGWVLPRATAHLVVGEDELRNGAHLHAVRPGGRLFEYVGAARLATGTVVLGDDRDGLAA